MVDRVDERYYQAATPGSFSELLTVMARDRIYDDFVRYCRPQPSDSILDVGVSDVVNDAANVLERKYPHQHQVTAAGLGNGAEFRKAFPLASYVSIEANQRLPFADAAFDIATSNAVLEHVGGRNHQEMFVHELLRAARKVFITVPHRYFPVEHHTAIPFLHYFDGSFSVACRVLNKSEWAAEQNLILMSHARLKSLVPKETRFTIRYTGLKLGPFSSNLMLFIDRSDSAS